MGQISFTSNLQRHLSCATLEVRAQTVRAALDEVFALNPRLESYLLDDQRRLRKHVNIYVNDRAVTDRVALSDPIRPEDELFVFQALSGG